MKAFLSIKSSENIYDLLLQLVEGISLLLLIGSSIAFGIGIYSGSSLITEQVMSAYIQVMAVLALLFVLSRMLLAVIEKYKSDENRPPVILDEFHRVAPSIKPALDHYKKVRDS